LDFVLIFVQVRSFLASSHPDVVHRGATPLLAAVRAQNHDIASLLLQNGANPNFQDEEDAPTPFFEV
jgi:ankyrin repeat protein